MFKGFSGVLKIFRPETRASWKLLAEIMLKEAAVHN